MTLDGAIGSIGPAPQDRERISDQLAELLHDPVPPVTPVFSPYPAHCVDGRPFALVRRDTPRTPAPAPADPTPGVPRLAGGTLTTWVIDLLTTGAFAPASQEARGAGIDAWTPESLEGDREAWSTEWIARMCAALTRRGHTVSSHIDDHASAPNAGCGAADSLGTVLGVLAQMPRGLTDLMTAWGVDPADLDEQVLSRSRSVARLLPPGGALIDAITDHAQGPYPMMLGGHGEVAVIANPIPGTTVDVSRAVEALARGSVEGSPRPQHFVVDTWTFGSVADFLLESARDAGGTPQVSRSQVVAATAAFNAATILCLCGTETPVGSIPA